MGGRAQANYSQVERQTSLIGVFVIASSLACLDVCCSLDIDSQKRITHKKFTLMLLECLAKELSLYSAGKTLDEF